MTNGQHAHGGELRSARIRLLAACCLAVTAGLRAAGVRGLLLWVPVAVLLVGVAVSYGRRRRSSGTGTTASRDA